MPIFEYLCPTCNRVYSFLDKNPAKKKQPSCPKCGAEDLKKVVSSFAVVGADRKSQRGGDSPAGDGSGADALDDPRVEKEMMRLMQQAEGMDENDPRQMGHLLRRMSEISGENLDGELGEAAKRLEAGEDPEKIEEEMGDIFPDGPEGMGGGAGGPSYDDGLYPM